MEKWTTRGINMNEKEQIKLLVKSLKLRLEQVKTEEPSAKLLVPCPLCEGLESEHGIEKCNHCIADESRTHICYDYIDLLHEAYDEYLNDDTASWDEEGKQALIEWLEGTIEEWENKLK